MNAALVLGGLIVAIAVLRAARRRARRGLTPRSRALFVVVAIITLNTAFGAPAALAKECGEAPMPERPGTGMVGALDSAEGRGAKDSPYKEYGYAGMRWYTYETDCGPLAGVTEANVTLDTWAGNQLFNLGKNVVGATNALHYTVMEGGLFSPLYDAIKDGTEAVYNNVYAQFFALVALLLAIFMFRHIWRGDMASVSKKALYALGAVWLAASSFALLRYFDDIDRAVVQTTTSIQAGFVDESENKIVRDVLPTNLHNEIVYDNWKRGLFGKPDTPEAKKHARDLLDAQAFTWAETTRGDDAKESVIKAKNAEYKRIANEMGTSQGYFTGEDGSRTGAGFIAFLQSLVYSLFQLLAKAAVLLAQILIRLLTLTAPILGLVALLHHDVLRRVGKVVGTVAFNVVVLAALAGVHALLLNAIFDATGMSMIAQMAIAAIATILLFVVGRPVRRLWQMVDVTTRAVGAALPASPGLFSRFRRQPEGPTPQDQFWQNARELEDAPVEAPHALGTATVSGRRLRPEANSPVLATAQRMDGQRPALPAGGAPDPVRLGFNPVGGRGDGMLVQGTVAEGASRPDVIPARATRVAPQQVARGWADDPDAMVVPSRLPSLQSEYRPANPQLPPSPPPVREPRRAEAEVINGRPVYVVYRPSRGLEVRQDVRDTDTVVR